MTWWQHTLAIWGLASMGAFALMINSADAACSRASFTYTDHGSYLRIVDRRCDVHPRPATAAQIKRWAAGWYRH